MLYSAVDQQVELNLRLSNWNLQVKLVPMNKNGHIFMLPYELSLVPILQMKRPQFKEEATACHIRKW